MDNQKNLSQYSGIFEISPDTKVNGEICLDGERTSVRLWTKDNHELIGSLPRTIKGYSSDLRKITLIDCVTKEFGSIHGNNELLSYSKLFPHYVVVGKRHIVDSDCIISCLSFTIDDATTLFRETEAFGGFFENNSILRQVVDFDNPSKEITIGGTGYVGYYTGKTTIFSSNTCIGEVSARHSPTFSIGNPDRLLGIENKIVIDVKFENHILIRDAISRMWKLLRFLELIVGRRQNLLEITVQTDNELETSLVYDNTRLSYPRSGFVIKPSNFDIAIDAVQDSQNFANILASWLERDKNWSHSRSRLSVDWGNRNYNVDRIIRAANMFDLLPNSEFPESATVSHETKIAVDVAKNAFASLPQSVEKQRVLTTLGMVGTWSLKKKILKRSDILSVEIGNSIPDIHTVINCAVNCRNLYVHGNDSKQCASVCQKFTGFFIETLEFVFAASDLVDMGWEIANWAKKPKLLGHPFSAYLASYKINLEELCKTTN